MRTALLVLLAVMPSKAFSAITYYHNDLLGSPVMATDEQAQVVWRSGYQPFGERIQSLGDQAAAHANPLGFTGHADDRQTGLIYMQARYYDPRLGRFMRLDPQPMDPQRPGSFNRYAYANNNPYKFVDPNGEDAIVFNISVQATLLENLAQYWAGKSIRVTGVTAGLGFSLADSNGNGIPEVDIGFVGTLDIDGIAYGASRINVGIQRSVNKDASLDDLVGFGAAVAVGGPGIGGKLSVAENGLVMLEGQAGAILPGIAMSGQGTGICSMRSGCRGWNSKQTAEPPPEPQNDLPDEEGIIDNFRLERRTISGWL